MIRPCMAALYDDIQMLSETTLARIPSSPGESSNVSRRRSFFPYNRIAFVIMLFPRHIILSTADYYSIFVMAVRY